MKNGEPQQQHFDKADLHLTNLNKLWEKASLSITPKMHTLLYHSVEQMKTFQGIGDTMEDDVEMMHQVAARIESRVSRMKNKDQQALRNADCCAVLKAKKLKEEREEKRSLTAEIVAKSNYETLTTAHQKAVEDKLMQDKISSKETQCTDS